MPNTDKNAFQRRRKTAEIKDPGPYISALQKEAFFIDERAAEQFKGRWREKAFQKPENRPMHLEIGPGVGFHFCRLCQNRPQDSFLALELKFKSLFQTLRRLSAAGLANGRGVRYNAGLLKEIFSAQEINNVFLYFPDPWPKKRHKSRRLADEEFAEDLFAVQRPGALLEFKTDAAAYFSDGEQAFLKAGYKIRRRSEDLHAGKTKDKAFYQTLSLFESLFVRRGLPVQYLLMEKPQNYTGLI